MAKRHKRNREEVLEKKKAKDERRQENLKRDGPKPVPRTIESTREPDDTWVDLQDEEVKEDEAVDQMKDYFSRNREPKVLITTSDNPHTKTIKFCRELKQSLETAEFRWRNRMPVKKMVKGMFFHLFDRFGWSHTIFFYSCRQKKLYPYYYSE